MEDIIERIWDKICILMGIFFGFIALGFVILKVLSVISWSWWWIFAPLWIPSSLILLLIIASAIMIVIKPEVFID